jgi:hypothetical protein
MLKAAKLSIEEKEALFDAIDTEGFRVLVNKIIPALLERKRTRVLTQTLIDQDSFTSLALARAELDGARALQADLAELKKHLKSADV